MQKEWTCYVSSALTGVSEELKILYGTLGLMIAALGGNAYLPQDVTDPVADPHVSVEEVYQRDRHAVSRADLVLAYVDTPSFGVGMELEMAHQMGIPVILVYKQGTFVSRIVRGCPAVKASIVFSTIADLYDGLRDALVSLGVEVNELRELQEPIVALYQFATQSRIPVSYRAVSPAATPTFVSLRTYLLDMVSISTRADGRFPATVDAWERICRQMGQDDL